MKTRLVRIGNSRGIRIPKPLIEQCGLGDAVEVTVQNDRLIITPERKPRENWRERFRRAGSAQNDELLLEPMGPNVFDQEEWTW